VALDPTQLTAGAKLSEHVSIPRPPHRLERLDEWMTAESLDATVAFGATNVAHLAGYSRYYGGPAGLVIGRDGSRTLVVMLDEVPVARELGDADEVLGYGERGFGINLDPLPLLAAVVAGVDVVRSAGRIGFSDEIGGMDERLRTHTDARQLDASGTLERIRLIKDEDELVKVLHSYELAWLAQRTVGELAQQPGITEIELFSAAHAAAQNANGAPIGFLTDLLSGPKSADVCCPIHVASPRAVREGEPVVADIALGAHGYWGDTAETHISGANAEVSEIRARLLEILAQAGSELVPGNTGSAIFDALHRRILESFPGGEFPHHGGHGISVSAFENPHLIPSDHTPFESWMLLAVEPGVYFPGRLGARVENIFLVTPDGGIELRDALGAR
jgi:Xaa-Pro aminopeptidase